MHILIGLCYLLLCFLRVIRKLKSGLVVAKIMIFPRSSDFTKNTKSKQSSVVTILLKQLIEVTNTSINLKTFSLTDRNVNHFSLAFSSPFF